MYIYLDKGAKDIVCYVQTLKSLSTNITKLKEAATTIKKRADTTKEDQAKKQPSIDAADLRKKADALRKEVQYNIVIISNCLVKRNQQVTRKL